MVDEACSKLLPAVMQWLKEADDSDESTREEVLADIKKATRGSADDGYQCCRRLESAGWDVDSSLVEVMDDYGFHLDNVLREAVKKWVAENRISPAFQVGTQVSITVNRKNEVGVIDEIRLETAEYLVKTDPNSTSRWVIAYENAKLA